MPEACACTLQGVAPGCLLLKHFCYSPRNIPSGTFLQPQQLLHESLVVSGTKQRFRTAQNMHSKAAASCTCLARRVCSGNTFCACVVPCGSLAKLSVYRTKRVVCAERRQAAAHTERRMFACCCTCSVLSFLLQLILSTQSFFVGAAAWPVFVRT